MKTIAQQWAQFEHLVMPKNSSQTQRKEMRRAFYGGFQSALIAGLEMADESKDNDDIGMTMIQRLHDECREFGREIQAGRA